MEVSVETKKVFRNYDQGDITATVKEHYRKMRSRQTYGLCAAHESQISDL